MKRFLLVVGVVLGVISPGVAGAATLHATPSTFAPNDHTPVARFTATPEPSAPGQTTTFDATSSICEDTPCVYHWHDTGPPVNGSCAGTTANWPVGSNGSTTTQTFVGLGTKCVELVLTDTDGDVDKVEHDHVVSNTAAPPASLEITNLRRDDAGTNDQSQTGLIWFFWDAPQAAVDHYNLTVDGSPWSEHPTSTHWWVGSPSWACGTSHTTGVEAVGTDGTTGPRNTKTMTNAACKAQVLFAGGFEPGDYSQYEQHQWSEGPFAGQSTYTTSNVGHSQCGIITSTVHEGRYASRCQVKPSTGTSATDRAEMVTSNSDATGDASKTQFYGWWTLFPSVNGQPQDWWPDGNDHNDFFQFGEYPNGLSGANWPYCGVAAHDTPVRLYCNGPGIPNGKVYLGSLVYDHWYHFVAEARWSTDPSVGYLSLWVDDVNVSPKTYDATLTGTATQVHVSYGMYRTAYSSTNTVVHDGLCRAPTYADAAAC